jgi:hypothetical protein
LNPKPRVSISPALIFQQRVKKGPENRISVVADKADTPGQPANDRSF